MIEATSGGFPVPETLSDVAWQFRDGIRHSVNLLRRLDGDSELTTAQVATLNAINGRPQRMTHLVRDSGVRQPTMSQHISTLESRGLVVRSPDPTDARASLIGITPEGRAILTAVNDERTVALTRILETLSEEDVQALARAIPVLRSLGLDLWSARGATSHPGS